MGLRDEILQQPEVLDRLITTQWQTIEQIAQELQSQKFDYLFLTARGTSDHAGLYAKYLFGIQNGLPLALAAPSIFSIYETPPNLSNALVVGISQSGMSPDIIEVLKAGKAQRTPSLVITNAPESPLAKNADYVIDICAGEEKAVAATKTYTAQLMAIALLSVALSGDTGKLALLRQVPGQVEEVLKLEPQIQSLVERFYYMEQTVILGRGYNYSTAYEWSLKLKELAYVVAEPYSPADFMHGPIAIVDQGFPVMVVAPDGQVYPEILAVIRKLQEERQPNLVVLSNQPEALSLADIPLSLPGGMPEWVSPMVSIVPAQLFCYWLTKLKKLDTEDPRGLAKVTETR